MCQFDMKRLDGTALRKKPVKLVVSHAALDRHLARRCQGDHDHRPVGGNDTAHSAHYTTAFMARRSTRPCRRLSRAALLGANGLPTSLTLPMEDRGLRELTVRRSDLGKAFNKMNAGLVAYPSWAR